MNAIGFGQNVTGGGSNPKRIEVTNSAKVPQRDPINEALSDTIKKEAGARS